MEKHPVRAAWQALRRTVAGPDFPPARLPVQRWPRLARYARPAGLLAVVGLFAATLAWETDRRLPGVVAILFAALTVAPLLALPRRPLLAWRLTIVALLTCTFNAPPGQAWPWNPVLVLGSLLVLAVVAARVDRPVLVWVGLITMVPVLDLVRPSHRAGVVVLVVALLVLGDLVRGNRAGRRALAEQTELSEREKERRAVLEERTRIAREMHDVVAHHMSMIAVQAETAPYRLGDLPEPARAEFAAVAGSAREALTDMRRLLGVLRSETAGPETAPQPGLTDLPAMVEAARRAGLAVTLDSPAPAARTPTPVGLAAYRIVQEGLANAARHAAGAAVRVTVRPGPHALAVRVENTAGTGGPTVAERGAGHGLTGMRERALALGGTFAAGPVPGGGYTVVAELPYDTEGAGG
ncbi:histidine kinase [Micromonospora sp. DR5-3]|uniref:sensor histidine kinase n=1 Tax=unclassified Micromonospora TaxID=2617518 RepID=UPI0011D91103|nr:MULTISPECIES: histidine kinase [unclassified Micromonospora]MCW3819366.1 histidine kinase [Micromonospora sp. DR5-3]TYC20872.1 two-component sensor histidine kinase [Micromonospora sp. MP36]